MNTSASAALVAACFLIGPSAEALTVTLDNPHQIVARPSSGSVRVSFNGTVKFDGETYDNYRLWVPFLEGSSSSNDDLFGNANCIPLPSLCNQGGSGELLWFFVDHNTKVGKYGYQIGSSTPASFSIFARDATGFEVESGQVFSIEVVEGVVPLPAAAWLLLSGLGGLGFLGRRRKPA